MRSFIKFLCCLTIYFFMVGVTYNYSFNSIGWDGYKRYDDDSLVAGLGWPIFWVAELGYLTMNTFQDEEL